jgi:hypothetical protein
VLQISSIRSNILKNSTIYKTAVILFALLSILNVIFSLPGIPGSNLTEGLPPFVIVLGTITGAAGLVAAWGAWRGQKWGIWLTIALSLVNGLSALPGVLFAPTNILHAGAILTVAVSIFVIVVLLLYRPTTAQSV